MLLGEIHEYVCPFADCSRRYTSRSGYLNHQKKHNEMMKQQNGVEGNPIPVPFELVSVFTVEPNSRRRRRLLRMKRRNILSSSPVRFLVALKRFQIRRASIFIHIVYTLELIPASARNRDGSFAHQSEWIASVCVNPTFASRCRSES